MRILLFIIIIMTNSCIARVSLGGGGQPERFTYTSGQSATVTTLSLLDFVYPLLRGCESHHF